LGLRLRRVEGGLGMVVEWGKSSRPDVPDVMNAELFCRKVCPV
jgi:hypothetical protein